MNLENLKASVNTYFANVLASQYADFAGRATRTQFWMFNLYAFAAVLLTGIIAGIIHLPVLSLLTALAILVPSIAVSVHRIRDLGISGWFILICLLPFVGGFLVFVGYCMPTDFLKPYAEKVMSNLKK